MPSSSLQVNYFPSLQTLWACRFIEKKSYAPRGKQRTGRREAQSRGPVNKIKKFSLYKTTNQLVN
jgi:hypothetical protein